VNSEGSVSILLFDPSLKDYGIDGPVRLVESIRNGIRVETVIPELVTPVPGTRLPSVTRLLEVVRKSTTLNGLAPNRLGQ